MPDFVYRLERYSPTRELIKDTYFRLTFRRNLGWKHAVARAPDALPAGPSFVTLTKNPYSWLLSLHKRPYNRHQLRKARAADFETFVASPWRAVGRGDGPKAYPNPVELWNHKNGSYVRLGEGAHPTLNLRYEDLLADPEATVRTLAEAFSLERVSEVFLNVEESTKREERDFGSYQDYYLKERWRDELTPGAIARINETLDWSLAERFGYARLGSDPSHAA